MDRHDLRHRAVLLRFSPWPVSLSSTDAPPVVVRTCLIGPNSIPVPIIVSSDDKTASRHPAPVFAIIARFRAYGRLYGGKLSGNLLRQRCMGACSLHAWRAIRASTLHNDRCSPRRLIMQSAPCAVWWCVTQQMWEYEVLGRRGVHVETAGRHDRVKRWR